MIEVPKNGIGTEVLLDGNGHSSEEADEGDCQERSSWRSEFTSWDEPKDRFEIPEIGEVSIRD